MSTGGVSHSNHKIIECDRIEIEDEIDLHRFKCVCFSIILSRLHNHSLINH